MTQLTGEGLVKYAKSKVGTPYFYGSKMTKLTESFMASMYKSYPSIVTPAYMQKARDRKQVGRVNVDCSGLIGAYRKRQLGSSQLYSSAYRRLSVSDYKNWANGVVCWRPGHVGIFFKEKGKYYVCEAKGINYGTVISAFKASSWKAGLTFSDISYTYDTSVAENATTKGTNPYKTPSRTLRKGHTGNDVRWVQWELCQSGIEVEIDGIFGAETEKAVRKFQSSAKIEDDGIVGKITRESLRVK